LNKTSQLHDKQQSKQTTNKHPKAVLNHAGVHDAVPSVALHGAAGRRSGNQLYLRQSNQMTHAQPTNRQFEHVWLTLQVFITPFPVLRFMERLGDPTLKTLKCAVDTMRASMLDVIHVRNVQQFAELGSPAGTSRCPAHCALPRPVRACAWWTAACLRTFCWRSHSSSLCPVPAAAAGGARSRQPWHPEGPPQRAAGGVLLPFLFSVNEYKVLQADFASDKQILGWACHRNGQD